MLGGEGGGWWTLLYFPILLCGEGELEGSIGFVVVDRRMDLYSLIGWRGFWGIEDCRSRKRGEIFNARDKELLWCGMRFLSCCVIDDSECNIIIEE